MAEARNSPLLVGQPSTRQAYRGMLVQQTAAHLDYVRVLANGAFRAGGFRIDDGWQEKLEELSSEILALVKQAEVVFESDMRDALERKELRQQRDRDPKLATFIDGLAGNDVGGAHG